MDNYRASKLLSSPSSGSSGNGFHFGGFGDCGLGGGDNFGLGGDNFGLGGGCSSCRRCSSGG